MGNELYGHHAYYISNVNDGNIELIDSLDTDTKRICSLQDVINHVLQLTISDVGDNSINNHDIVMIDKQ